MVERIALRLSVASRLPFAFESIHKITKKIYLNAHHSQLNIFVAQLLAITSYHRLFVYNTDVWHSTVLGEYSGHRLFRPL